MMGLHIFMDKYTQIITSSDSLMYMSLLQVHKFKDTQSQVLLQSQLKLVSLKKWVFFCC